MRLALATGIVPSLFLATALHAQTIQNPGFEAEWEGWNEIIEQEDDTAISENHRSGARSAKITGEFGRFEQVVEVEPSAEYELKAYIRGAGQIGLVVNGETFTVEAASEDRNWSPASMNFSSGDATEVTVFGAYNGGEGRFDDFEITMLESKSSVGAEPDQLDAVVFDDPVVRVLGADLSSEMSEVLRDVAVVTSEEDDIRVLSILGDGSIGNLQDLLNLRGIDAAVVQSDVLQLFKEKSAVRNVQRKLSFIAELGDLVGHLLAKDSHTTIADLQGRDVYIGEAGTGTFISASNIFDRLGITVNTVRNIDHQEALGLLKAGSLDAVFWMQVPPVGLLSLVEEGDGLHLIDIPSEGIDPGHYDVQELTSTDYEIIPGGETVQTVLAKIALIAYDWPEDHPRYPKMKLFTEILRGKSDELKGGSYNRAFRTVDFYSDLSDGWRYFD